jgi:Zn-dependent protease
MIAFYCKTCNQRYKVPDEYGGKQARCKKCGAGLKVPEKEELSPGLIVGVQDHKATADSSEQQSGEYGDKNAARDNLRHEEEFAPEVREVLFEIEKQENVSRPWQKNIAILAISLFVFFKLGLLNSGAGYIIALVLVLAIHEGGHLAGMLLFGYRNTQMLFIPFLGAAVSGEGRNIASYKKAMVALLGPAPGLMLGAVLLFVGAAAENSMLIRLAFVFLLLNAFNLLPFFPLDGGRFLNEIIFSRNRVVEMCFRLLASLALLLLAWAMGWWVLGILGLLNLLTAHIPFKLAGISNDLKKSFSSCHRVPVENGADEKASEVSPGFYKEVIDKVHGSFSPRPKAKIAAAYAKEVLERLSNRPPRALPTVGLLGVYLFLFLVPVVAVVGTMMTQPSFVEAFGQTRITEYTDADGRPRKKEQVYLGADLLRETELSDDGKLYHGKTLSYGPGDVVLTEGQWVDGRLHGEYKHFREMGGLDRVTVYDMDDFVSRKVLEEGRWVEKQWEELPAGLRKRITEHKEGPPRGPK